MDRILRKAYEVFLPEARQAARRLNELCAMTSLSAEENDELYVIAHKLRGGAGFFGCKELVAAASEFEAELKERDIEANPQRFHELMRNLLAAIDKLSA